MFRYIFTLLLFCVVDPVFAQSPLEPFTMETELGLISTTGNTKASSIVTKLDAKQDLKNWRTNYIFDALYKKDEVLSGELKGSEQTTAQRWYGSLQADYKIDTKHRALFVFGSYGKDRFSGFDYQATIAMGFSDRLFKTSRSHFDYGIGPGVSFNKFEEPEFEEESADKSAIIRLSANYLYQISENAKFTQKFSSNFAVESDENTRSQAETAISANLSSRFALKASLSFVHNTQVPESKVSLDTQTALTLVFSL